ncbi:hypothetical protein [Cytobacillus sp. IB215665]|uniref:hypothetical protein n=1 Tax=Cytobacillus sp. IB215665 TaxID=3097357 RepID=UPI002A16FEA4|nr:hypothetical protein [Cytobacillus sp. IB215665]MDX8367848.1 hypothetical protein [Cytobacillus sp. IB215665]
MAKTALELVELGKLVAERNKKPAMYDGYYITGAEYEEWISRVIFYLHDNKDKFPDFLYEKVTKAAEQAVGNGPEYFNEIIGVLTVAAERE